MNTRRRAPRRRCSISKILAGKCNRRRNHSKLKRQVRAVQILVFVIAPPCFVSLSLASFAARLFAAPNPLYAYPTASLPSSLWFSRLPDCRVGRLSAGLEFHFVSGPVGRPRLLARPLTGTVRHSLAHCPTLSSGDFLFFSYRYFSLCNSHC